MAMTPGKDDDGAAPRRRGDDEDARLRELRRRIDEQRARRERGQRRRGGDPRAAAHHLVLRLLADLGVALAAGLLLGWVIDHYLGSRPWGLLVGMLLGIAAGVRNVMHTADSATRSGAPRNAQRAEAAPPGDDPPPR